MQAIFICERFVLIPVVWVGMFWAPDITFVIVIASVDS